MNLTVPNHCTECEKPVVSIPLVTGGILALWCNEHLTIASEALVARLGQDTHKIIFSVVEHQVWFWEDDIRNALQAALDTLFEDIARDLHNVKDSIYGLENLIRVKAKEFAGILEFGQQEAHVIRKIAPLWMSPAYIDDIGAPLGEETAKILEAIKGRLISPSIAEIMVCLALSAKRAASYRGQDNSAVLINVERNIWNSHKITLGGINV